MSVENWPEKSEALTLPMLYHIRNFEHRTTLCHGEYEEGDLKTDSAMIFCSPEA